MANDAHDPKTGRFASKKQEPETPASPYDWQAPFDPVLDQPVVASSPVSSAVVAPEAGAAIPQPPPASSPPKHPQSLVKMATSLGLPEQYIASKGTDELGEVVYLMQNQRLELARDYANTAQLQQVAQRTVVQPPAPVAPPSPPPEDDTLDETAFDGYDDNVKKLARLTNKLLKSNKEKDERLSKLDEHAERFSKAEQARQQQAFQQMILAEMDKYPQVYGTNATRRADTKEGQEFLARADVAFWKILQLKDKTTPDADIARVTAMLFGNAVPQAPTPQYPPSIAPQVQATPPGVAPAAPLPQTNGVYRNPQEEAEAILAQRRKEWGDAGLAPVTQRRPVELPKGTERAYQAVAEKLRAQGKIDEFGDAPSPGTFLPAN